MTIQFGLIGNGIIADRHKKAIEHVGGELRWICDPRYAESPIMKDLKPGMLYQNNGERCTAHPPVPWMYLTVDYVVVCSPTYLHRQHVMEALRHGKKVICEKPLCLPWEPLVESEDVNIVLQLRYLPDLPDKAHLVRAVMVRGDEFFKTWKGDPRKAGGNIYEFFIHYIDLAILLGANFEGAVYPSGTQQREIFYGNQCLDIMSVDMQSLYNKMYDGIMTGGGVKPKDIFYLTWVLNRNSELYGYRNSGLSCMIKISNELL